jgi:hypothetical protein
MLGFLVSSLACLLALLVYTLHCVSFNVHSHHHSLNLLAILVILEDINDSDNGNPEDDHKTITCTGYSTEQ